MTTQGIVTRSLYILCLAGIAAAVLLPHYPPMVDLPQHVAAVATLDGMVNGDYAFAEMFESTWMSPYWLGYVLVWAASIVVGHVWAAKLVVATSLLTFVICSVRLRRHVQAPSVFDWLFLLTPFGFAYHWGMLNFVVAAPLGVILVHQFMRYLKGHGSWWSIALLMLLLLLAHVLTMAFAATVCALIALDLRSGFPAYLRKVAPLFAPLPFVVLWLTAFRKASSVGGGPWDLGWGRFVQLLPDIASLQPTWANVFVAAGLLALPWLFGRPTPSLSRLAPFGFYLLFMLLAPNYFMGNFFTYNRFGIFGMLMYALCFAQAKPHQPSSMMRLAPLLAAFPPLVVAMFLIKVNLDARVYERDASGFRHLMDHMEDGERVLGLIGNPYSRTMPAPVFLHYPAWYQAERAGLVDFNFAYWPGMNLHYRRAQLPAADENLLWQPWSFDWTRHSASKYRYFIVKGPDGFVQHTMGRYRDRVVLRAKKGDWLLFERSDLTGLAAPGHAAVHDRLKVGRDEARETQQSHARGDADEQDNPSRPSP